MNLNKLKLSKSAIHFYITSKNIFMILFFSLLFSSCQPIGKSFSTLKSAKTNKNSDFIMTSQVLLPTAPDEEVLKYNGYVIEPESQKIKNPQAELFIGNVKIQDTKVTYLAETKNLNIKGYAVLEDKKLNISVQSQFEIFGKLSPGSNTLNLKSADVVKSNSLNNPVVRASVTCLNIDENGEFDCSRAIVDFFIAYKKQFYTEQLEINTTQVAKNDIKDSDPKNSVSPSAEVEESGSILKVRKNPIEKVGNEQEVGKKVDDKKVDTPSKTKVEEIQNPHVNKPGNINIEKVDEKKAEAVTEDDNDFQEEGSDDSIPGRYQGQAATVDLKEIFKDDEGVTEEVLNAKTDSKNTSGATNKDLKKDESKKFKIISTNLIQTMNGDVRPINQSIGSSGAGYLHNANSVLTLQNTLKNKNYFEITFPERNRYYSTFELAEIIRRIGKFLNESYNKILYVGNISNKQGGTLYFYNKQKDKKGNLLRHIGHQIGLEADMGYPAAENNEKFPVVVSMRPYQYYKHKISIEKTYSLFKFIFSHNDIKVDRIIVDQNIKKSLCDYAKSKQEFNGKDSQLVTEMFKSIQHVSGHGNHFHLKLKCSEYDKSCKNSIYKANQGCN